MTTIVNSGIDQQIQAAPANSMTSLTINQVIGNKADANLSGPDGDEYQSIVRDDISGLTIGTITATGHRVKNL